MPEIPPPSQTQQATHCARRAPWPAFSIFAAIAGPYLSYVT